MASQRSRPRAVPAARSEGGRALSPDAAAGLPRRDDRLPRARRLRGALPAALGAADPGRRQVPRPRERQPGAQPPCRRTAWLDRRSQRACPRLERGGDAARALAGRPAEALAHRAEGAALARPDHRHPVPADPAEAEAARRRPAHARRGAERPARGSDPVPRGARGVVPRRPARPQLAAPVPVPVAGRAGARLRRPDLARRVQAAQEPGVLRRRLDRAGGRRVDLRQVSARPRRPGSADSRLAGPAEGPAAAGRAAAAGRQPAADDRPRPAAGGRAGAPLRHPDGPQRERAVRRRRRDRRARPERRVGARDGVLSDLPAVRLRRPSRREEAGAAARHRRPQRRRTTRA